MSKRKAVSFAGDVSRNIDADDAIELAYAEAVQSVDKKQRVVHKERRFKVCKYKMYWSVSFMPF